MKGFLPMSAQTETVVCILKRKIHRNSKLKMKLQRRALGHLREEVLATNPAQLAIKYQSIIHLLSYG